MKPPYRKIIHVDMDAFYASVAQLDDPTLRGKPIAVGGSGTRGVVSAASYEARKYGVRSAMSGVLAKKKCPSLIFVPTNFKRYKEISAQIRAIFYEFTDLVEPLSLDEAYLDVTVNKKNMPSATVLAQHIRHRILKEVGLHASAGISINKFIAKIASDINKPQGQKTVPPEEVLSFLENLDIAKFYGVGKVTRAKMYNLGIFTGADLKNKSEAFLTEHFKKSGKHYYQIVRGIHHSEVKPHRIQKSLAAEHTFTTNLTSEIYMLAQLQKIAKELANRAKKSAIKGKTITLKIKYSDFTLQTRSKTLPTYFNDETTIINEVKLLLYKEKIAESVRLLGISLSNLNTEKSSKEEPLEVQLKMEF
ncbi:DNA polymerase IV [Flavobacteriaceae bacterium F08102]|nr:DNA polymerase IV [Flavobacteriaceae bacterium F08102]